MTEVDRTGRDYPLKTTRSADDSDSLPKHLTGAGGEGGRLGFPADETLSIRSRADRVLKTVPEGSRLSHQMACLTDRIARLVNGLGHLIRSLYRPTYCKANGGFS